MIFKTTSLSRVPWLFIVWLCLPLGVGGEVTWSQCHRLWEQVRNTSASSFNTLHPCPIGAKKASLLNSTSWLAGISCASNPWSLRQSSIRSSRRGAFATARSPCVYIEMAPPFLLHCMVSPASVQAVLQPFKQVILPDSHIAQLLEAAAVQQKDGPPCDGCRPLGMMTDSFGPVAHLLPISFKAMVMVQFWVRKLLILHFVFRNPFTLIEIEPLLFLFCCCCFLFSVFFEGKQKRSWSGEEGKWGERLEEVEGVETEVDVISERRLNIKITISCLYCELSIKSMDMNIFCAVSMLFCYCACMI